MTVDEVVTGALETNPGIDTVYWVACGGSLIDLYPAHQLVSEYGSKVVSGAYTAREFCLMEPARLTERAFVVACSHSGNTPEVVDACRLACERGAAVLAFTDNADSAIMQGDWTCWVYPWGDDVRAREVPSGISLLLASELLDRIEGFELCDDMFRALDIMDDILPAARERVRSKLCPRFARLCQEHEFLYILGSGAVFSQAYALAICSLMEMQWQHCSYIHSGEYFHGPFEVTEPGVFYLLQMGSGPTRAMDDGRSPSSRPIPTPSWSSTRSISAWARSPTACAATSTRSCSMPSRSSFAPLAARCSTIIRLCAGTWA